MNTGETPVSLQVTDSSFKFNDDDDDDDQESVELCLHSLINLRAVLFN